VQVVVGNECSGEPAADEEYNGEYSCHSEVAAKQRQVHHCAGHSSGVLEALLLSTDLTARMRSTQPST
jgi:hypothetical protein